MSEAQLEDELGRLHEFGFRGLVTNAMAFGLERAPQIAKSVGFDHVVAKLWWQDEELLALEKSKPRTGHRMDRRRVRRQRDHPEGDR